MERLSSESQYLFFAGKLLNFECVVAARIGDRMQGDSGSTGQLPVGLMKRIEELQGRETSYIEDELYSQEALTNLKYRAELEKMFRRDPLGPLPAR